MRVFDGEPHNTGGFDAQSSHRPLRLALTGLELGLVGKDAADGIREYRNPATTVGHMHAKGAEQ